MVEGLIIRKASFEWKHHRFDVGQADVRSIFICPAKVLLSTDYLQHYFT